MSSYAEAATWHSLSLELTSGATGVAESQEHGSQWGGPALPLRRDSSSGVVQVWLHEAVLNNQRNGVASRNGIKQSAQCRARHVEGGLRQELEVQEAARQPLGQLQHNGLVSGGGGQRQQLQLVVVDAVKGGSWPVSMGLCCRPQLLQKV
jgi:hypothetical protein